MSFVPNPEEWEEEDAAEAPCLEVDITDPQVVGRLLDIHGEELLTIYDRETVEFGFQRSGD